MLKLRSLVMAGAALLMTLAPNAGFAGDDWLGVYQTTDRKMDYELTLCGKDHEQLCVRLVGIRGSADIPRTRAFLGKYVVDRAKPAGKNRWKGKMEVAGYTVTGTLRLRPGKSFVLHGCTMVVMCDDFRLIPAK
jgi:hypothetical protein